MLLAHNLSQNFPGGVAVVGACPPTATNFNFFESLEIAAFIGEKSILGKGEKSVGTLQRVDKFDTNLLHNKTIIAICTNKYTQ